MTHEVEESDWLAEGSKLIEEDVDELAAEIDRQAIERAMDDFGK